MDGWMDRRMGGWMDGTMVGWRVRLSQFNCLRCSLCRFRSGNNSSMYHSTYCTYDEVGMRRGILQALAGGHQSLLFREGGVITR